MSPDSGEPTIVRAIGRYHVYDEVGRGAMGVVYRGFDPLIGRTVALKTITFGIADAQAKEYRDRLYREAAAAGALSHPNIVTIFDIIEDKDLVAIAMEFIEGRSLAVIIAERAPLPVDVAVEILDQMCSALDYAGGQGIVHRDIKPANILVTAGGRAKVTDFGVARLALSTMTQAGTVLGSPSYMSPEQVRGLSLDGRSDLFAAAVVFFEMITRERPFAGDDIATTMYRIANEPPTPPTQFNPAVGPGIATVLERAFAKRPGDRFQTGAELAAALRAAASLGPTRGTSQALAALATAPPAVPAILVTGVAVPAAAPAIIAETARQASSGPAGVAAAPAATGSGGNVLAPTPVSLPPVPAAPSIQPASGPELPAIPLPPESGARPIRRPVAAPPPPAAHGRRRLALAGAAGVVVVSLGLAGALYLRGGPMPANEEPAVAGADAPAAQPADPAEAIPPSPPAAPPLATYPPAAPAAPLGDPGSVSREPTASAPRTPTEPRGKLGARPLPLQEATVPAVAATEAPAPPATPAANTAAARIYLATEVDVKPTVLTQVAPIYPDDAATRKVQDVVVLQVLVDPGGRPTTIKVLRGSQKEPLLDGAAAAAVRQWTFSPATKAGQPVPCWFNVGVPFPPVK
jgi:serine/threonine-protein kinase